ncbi:hypothetical protein, partial [Candidatus Erwinia dacicola]
MTDLTEVCSLGVKTPNQPVGMLIQAALLGMVRPRKIELRPRNLRDFLVQGEFRAIISGQSFKLAKSIGSMSLKAATTVFVRLLGSFRMMT